MQRRVQGLIKREGLIASGDHVLAAVSGGADSVFLLHQLSSTQHSSLHVVMILSVFGKILVFL